MNKGNAYIDGRHYETSTDKGALSTHNSITYVLYRERFGPDKSCASMKCKFSTNPKGKIGTADEKSSKYYLQVYKVEDYGHNIADDGKVYGEPLDIGLHKAEICADSYRVNCLEHGVVTVAVPWARHNSRYALTHGMMQEKCSAGTEIETGTSSQRDTSKG